MVLRSIVLMAACGFIGVAHAKDADGTEETRGKGYPVAPLTDPFGVSAGLLGGGSAVVSDVSAVDLNPAGLALAKEVLISGEVKWTKANTTAVEAGVQDSLMSEVAAGLKYRTSTKYSGGKDRRFSLGFAQPISESGVIVGIGGDYRQVERSQQERDAGQSRFRESPVLRAGGLYRLSDSVLLAAATDGWLDNYVKERKHTFGAATAFAQHYILNADLVLHNAEPFEALFGFTVLAKEFLDLRVGYGYQLDSKRQKAAAGFTVKSQQFRLLYTVSKTDLRKSDVFHQVGVGLTMAF
jgi:hypothetical protein